METPQAILDDGLSAEDREAMKQALLTWRAAGVENPLIPSQVDIDGDGLVESFGLDENDEVVLILSTNLVDTVYESKGDDISGR